MRKNSRIVPSLLYIPETQTRKKNHQKFDAILLEEWENQFQVKFEWFQFTFAKTS